MAALAARENVLRLLALAASDPASEAYLAEARAVDADLEFGKSLGISGTPGFFVNGTFLNGALPFSAFEAIIEQAKGQQS